LRPLLDQVGEVAGENLPRLAERHRWVRAELLLEALLIAPLLRHPVCRDTGGHGFHDQDKAPCTVPLTRLSCLPVCSTCLRARRISPSVRLGTRLSHRLSSGVARRGVGVGEWGQKDD